MKKNSIWRRLTPNRALLPLTVLIAVPLLLHLFARSRPPRYAFPSTELLLRAVRIRDVFYALREKSCTDSSISGHTSRTGRNSGTHV